MKGGFTVVAGKYVLLTNNPLFSEHLSPEDCNCIDGSAWDVLVAGRDRIHAGARLLNHPRYGNFYPNQQPYRSLLLHQDPEEKDLHMESLDLLEDALAVWRTYEGRWAQPANMETHVDSDYAQIDLALMKESLLRYDLWLER